MNPRSNLLRTAALGGLLLFPLPFAQAAPQLGVVEEAVLQIEGAAPEIELGTAVDISGDLAVVGAGAEEVVSGAAFVYRKDLVSGNWQLESKLLPPSASAAALDQFGSDVAIDGDWIAVGATSADGAANSAGAVFLYRLIAGDWIFTQEVHAPNPQTAARFGRGLDLCGGWLAAGAWKEDATADESGAVHVYGLSGDTWLHSQTLTSPFAIEDEAFGFALDCSGARLAIGAPGFPIVDDSGAVYVFELGQSGWGLEQQLTGANVDNLGQSVAIHGSHVLAGAPLTDDVGPRRGAVCYFERGAVAWSFRQRIDGQFDNEYFGTAVALSREDAIEPSSPMHALVGAYRFSDSQPVAGRAQFMTLDPVSNWNLGASITSPAPAPYGSFGYAVALDGRSALIGEPVTTESLLPDEGAVHAYNRVGNGWQAANVLRSVERDSNDFFGDAVALAGDLAVVGMPGDDDVVPNGGSALVYRRTGSSWTAVAKISAGISAKSGARFGDALATDGETIVVGAPDEDGIITKSGAVYVFRENAQGEWRKEARLVASDEQITAAFGASVDVDGDRIAVGAPLTNDNLANTGAVYIFERDREGEWNEEERIATLGSSPNAEAGRVVALDGDFLVFSAPDFIDGIVITYAYQAGVWNFTGSLNAFGSEGYGAGLALDGELLVIGAPEEDAGLGGVHIFERVGTDYSPIAHLQPQVADTDYGHHVALDGDLLVVGAQRDAANGHLSGAAYAYRDGGVDWIEERVVPLGGTLFEQFGCSVAASQDRLLIGAFGAMVSSNAFAGEAHVFEVEDPNVVAVGFGDGSEAACPCGNESPVGAEEGCLNSTGFGGRLEFQGSTDLSANDVTLRANQLPIGVTAQLFTGTQLANAPTFGDGLRFAGGMIQRFGTRQTTQAGTATWMNVQNQAAWTSGQTRVFQVLYRDVAGPCGSGFNLTSAMQITFDAN